MVSMELGEFLYDLDSDPSETINRIEENPAIYQELKVIHANWRKEIEAN